MRNVLAALILFCLCQQIRAQDESFSDVSHLLRALQAAKTDTARALLKARLAEAYRSNHPDTSLLLATESLQEARATRYARAEARALSALSVLHREKGDLPQALNFGLAALRLAEQERLPFEHVFGLVRVAIVYLNVGDQTKGVLYLNKAEELLKSHFNLFQWVVVNYFLADVEVVSGRLEQAEARLQSLEQKTVGDPSWIILTRRLRGMIAMQRGKLNEALGLYRESLRFSENANEIRESATTCNAMAAAFRQAGQFDSAVFYAKKGLDYGQALSYRNRILAAADLLAELHAEKDPAAAVRYYQIAAAVRDSLYGVKKVQQLQAATMRERERQAGLEAQRIADQNRQRQWALFAGILVILTIAVILYRSNRQKHQARVRVEKAYGELKAAQQQLIHSEKMASLGELTAGIAHEIQNPLNFVNNFSDLNRELALELEEAVEAGDLERIRALSKNIKDNEEKILFHGKRADGIVKNMLQHSRKAGKQKEATDLNALVDEYVRLAYHGHRAKDKSFNAKFETVLDTAVGKLHLIPGEFGRVILNLANNAFYAVAEKKRMIPEGYEPLVTVSTRRTGNRVLVRIQDNGNGIPPEARPKIFQPFFTTKPTGEGTGLGLSLSYDIVTRAHSGELTVETSEGNGTSFLISLPASTAASIA